MTIRFKCSNGHTLQVPPELAGREGVCPKCGTTVQVPRGTEESAAPADASSRDTIGGSDESTLAAAPKPVASRQPQAAEPPASMAPVRPVAKAVARAQESGAAVWRVQTPAGEQFGPATDDQFRQWIVENRVSPDSHVWRAGWSEWRLASEVVDALPVPLPPAPAVSISPTAAGPSAATRYTKRRQQSKRRRLFASVLLLVLTLTLGGVLLVVLNSEARTKPLDDADAEPAEAATTDQ